MLFNTTFNNIQLYCGDQFYWWRKLDYTEKTTDNGIIYKNDENKIGQLHVHVLVRIICSIIRGRHVPVM